MRDSSAKIARVADLRYKDCVTKQPLLRIALLTLLAFGVQAAYSPAAHAVRQMRAAKCCVENCDHSSFTSPMRCGCCITTAAPDATSAISAGKPDLQGTGSFIVASLDGALRSQPLPAPSWTSTRSPRAAPVFLLNLNLQR